MDEKPQFDDYTWRALVDGLENDDEWLFDEEEEDEDDVAPPEPHRPWEELDSQEHLERIGPSLLELLQPHLFALLTTGQLPPAVAAKVREMGDGKVDPRALEFFAAGRALGEGELATRIARPLVDKYRGFESRILDAFGIAVHLNAVELPPLTAGVFSRAIQMYLAGFYEGAITFVMSALETALAISQAGDESLGVSKLLAWASRQNLIDDAQIRAANRLVGIRNDIVHNGVDASAEQARMAIQLVGDVLTALHVRRNV